MPTPPTSTAAPPRARRVAVALGLALAVVAPVAAARPVASSPAGVGQVPNAPDLPNPAALAPPAPGLPGLPDVSRELAGVEVDGPELRRAASAYLDADGAHASARDARAGLDREHSWLVATEAQLQLAQTAAESRVAGAERRLGALEGAIQELVVSRYVDGAGDDRVQAALADASPSVHDAERRAVLATTSLETLLSERAAYTEIAASARAEATAAARDRQLTLARLFEIAVERPDAEAAEVEHGGQLAGRRAGYEEARVLARVAGADFPLVALDAYHRAARRMAEEQPGCGLRWWGLAGISRVEGRHGTYGGASLGPDGQTSQRIIGIALDGNNQTRAIPDTDGGALDGDPVWDRAVGPMQFIPTTWAMYQSDGNGNGVADPHNLYDATLAAARYLCRTSGGLDGDDGLRRAYFAYNNSLAYVDNVLGYARGYERAIHIPPG